ncbi:hypothetical protein D3Y59_18080 (plasmid) [Hymenobacter oligotrophus]|uniref:Uncharacterized protein n=1 Tax=Hymenobacter oligotrophus TaxID=2319843 RepID=A0A3B7R6T8_9BACT|nr:hypothetical protein D3Y59_18080 [Hymenobacter oligotrophus]
MQKLAIEIRYTHDKGGVLRGVSFETGGVAFRGQEVGYKGAQLREALAAPVRPAMEPEVERKARPEVSTIVPQPAPPERPKQTHRKGRRQ